MRMEITTAYLINALKATIKNIKKGKKNSRIFFILGY